MYAGTEDYDEGGVGVGWGLLRLGGGGVAG